MKNWNEVKTVKREKVSEKKGRIKVLTFIVKEWGWNKWMKIRRKKNVIKSTVGRKNIKKCAKVNL